MQSQKDTLVIAVASQNPKKVEAVEEVAFQLFGEDIQVVSRDIQAKISVQPISDEETILGCYQRAQQAIQEQGIDYAVGIESGVRELVEQSSDIVFSSTWAGVIDRAQNFRLGSSGYFALPTEVSKQILSGRELGPVMDELTGMHNIKQDMGANGFLTKGHIDRQTSSYIAVMHAFVSFVNPQLYKIKSPSEK